MSTPMVEAVEVRKSYGRLEVLNGISLKVQRGSVTCIIGPSGSGKSTFLRCINHLESVDTGQLLVDGRYLGYRRQGRKLYELKPKEISSLRAEIGMVFQNFNLFPHMTVMQNLVDAPIHIQGETRRNATERAVELLERVGLADKAGSYPRHLSGGQQQRVAIARALAMRPKLMLFDEPTSALDPELVREVLDVMRDLTNTGITMIVVTHEIGFAKEVADTVYFLDEGAVVESGDPKAVLEAPRQERTRSFLSRVV